MKGINKDETRPFFVDAPNNLGAIYENKKQYDKAIEYYIQSLDIYKLIHKNKPHQDIAACLQKLISLCIITRQYNNEEKYSNEFSEMMKLIIQDDSYKSVASPRHNLMLDYYLQCKRDERVIHSKPGDEET